MWNLYESCTPVLICTRFIVRILIRTRFMSLRNGNSAWEDPPCLEKGYAANASLKTLGYRGISRTLSSPEDRCAISRAAADEEEEEEEEEEKECRLKIVAPIKSVRNGARGAPRKLILPNFVPSFSSFPPFHNYPRRSCLPRVKDGSSFEITARYFYKSTYPYRFAPPIAKHPVYAREATISRGSRA